MTEVTFEKLINDTHSVIWKILRANIPRATIRHIDDGYSTELKNNESYPHIQIVDPTSDDDITNHCLDYTTLKDISIEVDINVYTLTAKKRREVIDLIRYTIMRNLKSSQVTGYDSLNDYGLTSPTFTVDNTAPALIPDDDAERYEYVAHITITFEWSGASV